MKKKSKVFEEKITCPWCKKGILIKKERETISETIKGEFKETVTVKKDTQAKLAKSWLNKRPSKK